MHIADVEGGNLGANGVVGGGIPIAVGVGLGLKMQKTDKVILCFFGDGASNTGAFHEALNMTAIYELPVVFVCENNQYAMSFSIQNAVRIEELSTRAVGYGMRGKTVDGNDIIAVHNAVSEAVKIARETNTPSLIENVTYRWRGHSKSDANRYRTQEEIELWKERCPIKRFKNALFKAGWFTVEQLEDIEKEAYAAIESAVEFAENSPEPDIADIEEGVYA